MKITNENETVDSICIGLRGGAFRKSFERIENADGIQKRNVGLGDLKPKPWVQPIVEVWHRKSGK